MPRSAAALKAVKPWMETTFSALNLSTLSQSAPTVVCSNVSLWENCPYGRLRDGGEMRYSFGHGAIPRRAQLPFLEKLAERN